VFRMNASISSALLSSRSCSCACCCCCCCGVGCGCCGAGCAFCFFGFACCFDCCFFACACERPACLPATVASSSTANFAVASVVSLLSIGSCGGTEMGQRPECGGDR